MNDYIWLENFFDNIGFFKVMNYVNILKIMKVYCRIKKGIFCF